MKQKDSENGLSISFQKTPLNKKISQLLFLKKQEECPENWETDNTERFDKVFIFII